MRTFNAFTKATVFGLKQLSSGAFNVCLLVVNFKCNFKKTAHHEKRTFSNTHNFGWREYVTYNKNLIGLM